MIRTGIEVPFCLTHGLNSTATGAVGGEAGKGEYRVPGQTQAGKACHMMGFSQKCACDYTLNVHVLCVCVIICMLVCFSVVSRVRVRSLWSCGCVSRDVSFPLGSVSAVLKLRESPLSYLYLHIV